MRVFVCMCMRARERERERGREIEREREGEREGGRRREGEEWGGIRDGTILTRYLVSVQILPSSTRCSLTSQILQCEYLV